MTDFARNLRFRRWLDKQAVPLPGDPDAAADAVAELDGADPAAGPPRLFLNEFQSRPDPDMFGRLLVYLGHLWLAHRPDPLPGGRYRLAAAVVNLTGTARSLPASASFVFPGPDGTLMEVRPRERYLAAESAEDLLGRIEAGAVTVSMLSFIPLMRTADTSGTVARWLAVADERKRAEYASLASTLSELTAHEAEWKAALKGRST